MAFSQTREHSTLVCFMHFDSLVFQSHMLHLQVHNTLYEWLSGDYDNQMDAFCYFKTLYCVTVVRSSFVAISVHLILFVNLLFSTFTKWPIVSYTAFMFLRLSCHISTSAFVNIICFSYQRYAKVNNYICILFIYAISIFSCTTQFIYCRQSVIFPHFIRLFYQVL